MSVRVSVVVPTFRRADLLDRCLSALTAQDCDAASYEVIVADDAADDDTRRQVEEWAGSAPCAVRYVAVTGPHGPAAARNAGWRAARGEVVAFTDDDCVPDPGWVRAGAVLFSRGVGPAADAVTADADGLRAKRIGAGAGRVRDGQLLRAARRAGGRRRL